MVLDPAAGFAMRKSAWKTGSRTGNAPEYPVLQTGDAPEYRLCIPGCAGQRPITGLRTPADVNLPGRIGRRNPSPDEANQKKAVPKVR